MNPSPEQHELLARSLVQIKQLRKQLHELREASHEPIAIVGVGLRLPSGIGDPEGLRERLRAGFDAVTEIPRDRWDLAQLFDPDSNAPGKMYTRHGAFLDEIDHFDAHFFGISPKEAAAMDPQQRLFLEVVHEALERAGIDVRTLEESNAAVFAGATTWDHGARQAFRRPLTALDPYVMSGNIAAFLAGRVAYTYGLQGPCMTIDTACSSSLVAVHLAVASLRRGETDLALAGGVNVILAPEWNVVLSRARMMAVDGRCKTFDAAADGYVRGEGCAVLVLKRWSQAQRDGDAVLALIRGSAINQDGPASGITVPNGLAQQKVVRAALDDARVEPASVGYVEAHGTGTSLGDPIEVRGLAAVYGQGRRADQRLCLGSIKTNLGHLEPAAGVVGLVKAALSVHHGEIYPHLHLRTLNPEIELESIPAEIATELRRWEAPGGEPRRAGISSFGASGTNVHVIVEQAPDLHVSPSSEDGRVPRLLVLSAKTEAALEGLVHRQRDALSRLEPDRWPDLCATSQRGRACHAHRLAVVASDALQARQRLDLAVAAPQRVVGAATGTPPRIAMIFAGQGAQALGMGRQLRAQQPVFREALERCDEILRPMLGHSLHEIIDGAPGAPSLDETAFTQPAVFAVEYALAQLWGAWGVQPTAVLGHSVGQYVAATVAGVFELSTGLALIVARARLMQELRGEGAMVSLRADESRVGELLAPYGAQVSIAALNGPTSTVISGLRPDVDHVVEAARAAGIKARALTVSHAFHSPQMEPMLDAFRGELARFELRPPQITLISNLDGRAVTDEVVTPEYWCRHVREPVRFADGLATLHAAGYRVLVEASPRPTLSAMAKTQLPVDGLVVPSLRANADELESLLTSLGALLVRGVSPKWEAVDSIPRRRVAPPTYPFQRRRHWVETADDVVLAPRSHARRPGHPLVERRVPNPLVAAHFEVVIGHDRYGFLRDFVIDEVNVVNIGVYVELLRGGLYEHLGRSAGVRIEDLAMQRACLLRADGPSLQLLLHAPSSAGMSFSIHGDTAQGTWVEHCGGGLCIDVEPALVFAPPRTGWVRSATGDELYAEMEQLGIVLGPAGRWITSTEVDAEGGGALAALRAPTADEAALCGSWGWHPGVIDALFQAAYTVLPADRTDGSAYMLVGVASLYVAPGAPPTRAHVVRRRWDAKARALTVDIVAVDGEGRVVITVEGATLKYASRELLRAQLAPSSSHDEPRTASRSARARQALQQQPPERRAEQAREHVGQQVALVMGAEPGDLEPGASLLSLGLDSLMAVDLKRALAQELGLSVPLSELLEGPSVDELCARLLGSLDSEVASSVVPTSAAPMVALPDPERANEPFSLTELQQAYLIGRGEAFELGNVSTHFFLEVEIDGLDVPRAERAWNRLVRRHGMLRAVFTEDGRQRVLGETPAYEIAVDDLRGLPEASRRDRLAATAEAVRDRVFDPGRWPLFEIRASRLDDRTTRLQLGFDALVVDAWSTSMLFDEWARAYREQPLPALELGFRDYMVALDALRSSEQYARDVAYWEQRLEALPSAPELPLACSPDALDKPCFGHRSGRLSSVLWGQLQEHAREAKVTPSAALCTVYAETIARWSRNRHFTLNLLFFNRLPLHPEVKHVVANFSSTTLLEVDARADDGFGARAQQIQRQLAEDLEHGLVTGVEVLRRINRRRGGRGATMPVVFASTINLRARDRQDHGFGLTTHLVQLGDGGREIGSSIRTPQVWLDHQVLEESGSLVFNWDVVEELFPPGMIDSMFAHYTAMLHRLAEDASAWEEVLGRQPLAASELAARDAYNATRAPSSPRLLHEAFVDHAERSPERVAVISGSRCLSYRELDSRSELLARALLDLDLGPDRLVAVMLPKGWEQIVAVLAIHKAGAAYVPIDPSLPRARIEHLLGHAGVKVALVLPEHDGDPSSFPGIAWVVIDPEEPALVVDADQRLRPDRDPSSLAYVIYTSGSTGLPKGVAVSHAAAWNTIVDISRRFELGAEDRTLAISSLSFDLSVYDVFGLLSVGGALVIPEREQAREPAEWARLVREHGVTVWNSVPALMQMLTEHVAAEGGALGSLRLALLSGDWIPVALPDALRRVQPGVVVVSLGGATEAAIWSIHHVIGEVSPQWSSIPYGRPLTNQRFEVLDDDLEPRPVWVPGQLYIAGDGLALGYWKDEERTAASFSCHPRTGERLYRTGDLGRYLGDGTIEFLGREDDQVKVQGYRIELGEIDAALDRVPELRAGVAAVVGDRMASRSLVAYVVPAREGELDHDAIRRRLEQQLPAYMVPTTIVAVEALPLTSNGKVDRKALLSLHVSKQDAPGQRVAPRDELERRLAELWQELLQVEAIGVFDDFFALGGQSFLGMRLVAQIRERLGVSLPLATLLSDGTVAAQAQRLRQGVKARAWSPVVEIQRGPGTPLCMVHPVGGNVLCYLELARGLAPRAVLGLTASGLLPGQPPLLSIGAMADRYLAALDEAGVSGPLHLAGWSLGGVVAFEMARRAEAAGRSVERLVLIDSVLEARPSAAPRPAAELLAGFLADLGRGAGRELGSWALVDPADFDPALTGILERLEAAGVVPPDLEQDTFLRLWEVYRAGIMALDEYRPEPWRGSLLEVVAEHREPLALRHRWSELCLGRHELRRLPGDHYTLVQPPHRSALVEVLASHLDALEPNTPGSSK